MPQKLRKTMKAVCSAIYDGVISAANERVGKKVKMVMERLQVAKFYRQGWDTVRKQELRRVKQEISEEAYKHLQGMRWALRKKKEESTDEEKGL